MPDLRTKVDADFYSLIHRLVGPPGPGQTVERRADRRQPFASLQRIAWCAGREMPEESEFVEIRCRNLSGRGFSFFLPKRPDGDSLVAAFGTPEKTIYVAAKVSYTADVLVWPSGRVERIDDAGEAAGERDRQGRPATPVVLVGCRFTERLSL